jgi:choline dehydrogenase-like flavoprotein
MWAPRLGMTGPQRVSLLGRCAVLSGVGVGGGSLIYGNTLYEPLPEFFTDKAWAHITDWRTELAPYYDQAKRMLGVARNPRTTPADTVLREVAEEMGVGDTFHMTDVGVFKQGIGEPNPTWIPIAHDVARRVEKKLDGDAISLASDVFNIPATAHYLGGATIGTFASDGVVDPYQRVFGHPGLHIADGSAVTANLGVNPSLTITAQAERAMAFWPNKGEADPRPPLGSAYKVIDPVAPNHPVVPTSAVGALRLPIAPR